MELGSPRSGPDWSQSILSKVHKRKKIKKQMNEKEESKRSNQDNIKVYQNFKDKNEKCTHS